MSSQKFFRSILNNYVGATIGGILSDSILRGLGPTDTPIDFKHSFLSAMKTGTTLSSFPLSTHFLSEISPKYKSFSTSDKIIDKILYFTIGGAGAAGIYAVINYPIISLQEGKKQNFNELLKGISKTYTDRLGASIGFSATMETLQKTVPYSTNSAVNWIRNLTIVHLSNIAGKTLAYPIHHLKYGTPFSKMVKSYLDVAFPMTIHCDCVGFYKKQFMPVK
ncbi:hypothetical protein GPJ56_004438 [Histomonas meleagridis]|uniref:uncharacterized protein n=1 Tax=Histomonas meleagridis TaxID=135588 RepID=UPI00355AA9B2|nr:hypothetical protein GPJ56_004438 [Histomonas meleagridis]KAH0802034.1 hypothetical protein GO595_005115 [Histomonas meleagridis]